jgi:hypothetical protein
MHARTHVQSACAPFFLDAWISRKCFSLLVWIYTRRQTHAVCHCLESASPGQRLRRRRFLSIMLQSAAQLPSFPRGRGVENSVPRLVPLSGYPCPALNPPHTHTAPAAKATHLSRILPVHVLHSWCLHITLCQSAALTGLHTHRGCTHILLGAARAHAVPATDAADTSCACPGKSQRIHGNRES